MTDELLPYYDKELSYIKRLAGDFADLHPKIASRLRISQDTVEDPHVSRLIESFAYLTARTRRKIEDDFPELSEAILNVLYPHYLAPFPSCAITRFELNRTQIELTSGYEIPRGAVLETEPIDGEPCRFRTCYPVKVWPFSLSNAEFRGPPFAAPVVSFADEAKSVLHLQLSGFSSDIPFSNYEIGSLRFFLNGNSQSIFDLYEFLLNDVLGIAIATSPSDKEPVLLTPDHIKSVGFEKEEGLIDYPARSAIGYRLLTEYFAFPEKFLFFDIEGLSESALARSGTGSELHLFIYLKNYSRDVENNTRPSSFQIGGTPIVNLFRQRAEPIQLSPTQYEYRIVPDARRPLANEIFSIDEVVATTASNEELVYHPFYSINHQHKDEDCYWYPTRKSLESQTDKGTEVYLNLIDLDFQKFSFGDRCLDVTTTSFNRDLPARLPIDAKYSLTEHSELIDAQVLVSPTATSRPMHREGSIWRLISHLNLNHISLSGEQDAAVGLREILKLYDLTDSPVTKSMIDGILKVSTERVVGRVGGPIAGGFCRGTAVTIEFNEDKFVGCGVFLFASVIERFLGLYASINSFSKTKAVSNKRGLLFESKPRNGYKPIF